MKKIAQRRFPDSTDKLKMNPRRDLDSAGTENPTPVVTAEILMAVLELVCTVNGFTLNPLQIEARELAGLIISTIPDSTMIMHRVGLGTNFTNYSSTIYQLFLPAGGRQKSKK